MLTSDQIYAVAGCATVAGGAVGWLAGHLRTTRRYERDGGLMDQTYDEGNEDAWNRANAGTAAKPSGGAPAEDHAAPAGSTGAGGAATGAATFLASSSTDPEPSPPADFLHPDFEQLDPARLDAANQDLPGPVTHSGLEPSQSAAAGGAGEHQLPSILHLGHEFDGSDKTAARVAWRLWDMTARFEQERARFRAECGLGIAA
jgi:hypothetical protein